MDTSALPGLHRVPWGGSTAATLRSRPPVEGDDPFHGGLIPLSVRPSDRSPVQLGHVRVGHPVLARDLARRPTRRAPSDRVRLDEHDGIPTGEHLDRRRDPHDAAPDDHHVSVLIAVERWAGADDRVTAPRLTMQARQRQCAHEGLPRRFR